MNVERLINMIFRMVVRKAARKGVNAAADKMTGGGTPQDKQQMSPEDRRAARQARQAQKRARQAMKLTRRM